MSCCGKDQGPGYRTPLEARGGPREKILYTTVTHGAKAALHDYLATVDVDPESQTYAQVVHRTTFPYAADEAHHTGWNACSSCFGDAAVSRSHLIVPCLNTSRVYVVDTATSPRAPTLHKTIEPEELLERGVSFPHTTHCLADGNIMISTLGDEKGDHKGSFLLLNSKTFEVVGKWTSDEVPFGYDYWYQPRHNVMISTAWGAPSLIKTGFNPQHVADKYDVNSKTFEVVGKWTSDEVPFGYDYWYQPRHNVMISTAWGAPSLIKTGFNPQHVADKYDVNSKTFEVVGKWTSDEVPFGYDYWYQPRHNVMISTAWGAPSLIKTGFNPQHVADKYDVNSKTFEVVGKWTSDEVPFGYDYWYQPRHNVMISTAWGAPSLIKTGFNPQHVADKYDVNSKTFEVVGKWTSDEVPFGYDYWYQPRHNVMISTAWGAPSLIKTGFNPQHVADKYDVNSKTFEVVGKWTSDEVPFGYDYWYQPRHNVMISTAWGAPSLIKTGFNPQHVADKYDVNSKTFEVVGKWTSDEVPFGYDYWYQPRHNVMISTAWGAPSLIKTGFNPQHVADKYDVNSKTFEVVGKWTSDEVPFGYDYWYQPRHNVMISTAWGAPSLIKTGFNPQHVADKYDVNSKTFEVVGKWTSDEVPFGYDYWYQPRHNVMISTAWGAPSLIKTGFNPQHVADKYDVNSKTFEVVGKWTSDEVPFGYDYWYQPRHNVMISTAWGAPSLIKTGFNPQHVADKYDVNSKTFEVVGKWTSDEVPFGYDYWYQPRHNVMISTAWGAPSLIKTGFNPQHVADKYDVNSKTFEVVGKWTSDEVPFGYDYWYQPRHNVMISTAWGAPSLIKTGFNPQHVADKYDVNSKTFEVVGKWTSDEVPFGYDYWYQPRHNVMISTAWGAPSLIKTGFNPQHVADKYDVNSKTFEVVGKWTSDEVPFGYDYWYQPRHNVMISTAWGAPSLIKTGFNPQHVADKGYGNHLYVYDWENRSLKQTIEMDPTDGALPLEVRFKHDPESTDAFVGCALSSNVYHIFRKPNGTWDAKKVVDIPAKDVSNWALPQMPGLITDILVSLDDRFLFISLWLHGDIRMYNIQDPQNPRLVGQVWVGGSVCDGGPVKVTKDLELRQQPRELHMGGRKVEGGPQMLQLSLDGRRLYVTNSLYSVWDQQFYPDLVKKGGVMLQIDVDTQDGGLRLNRDFLVDFAKVLGKDD